MSYSENGYEELKFVNNKIPNTLDKESLMILSKIVEMTNFHNINTRNSLNEFLTRVFISMDCPLNTYIDNFFKDTIIIKIETNYGNLILDLDLITDLIGLTNGFKFKFNYVGTTEEFICQYNASDWPKSYFPKVKKTLKNLNPQEIRNARIIAEYFTDKIEDRFFISKNEYFKSNQYCRKRISFECMEINQVIYYKPFNSLTEKTIHEIQKSIGYKKLDPSKNIIDNTIVEERLEDVIVLAYGIKNGFIDWRGALIDDSLYIDPYYIISFSNTMDVFVNSKTFMDMYYYWNMFDWIDLLPNHKK